MQPVVTLDGPAGSGKSSIARLLCERYPFFQVDSGALYRTYTHFITLYSQEKGESIENLLDKDENKDENKDETRQYIENIFFEINFDGSRQQIKSSGEDMEKYIRKPAITEKIKAVADCRFIRELVNKQIQLIAENHPLVADGRDMGTVVFPHAELKLFITASLSARAKRRHKEFLEKNPQVSLEDVELQISRRDKEDESREYGGLRQAEDAIFIDTTSQSLEDVLELVENLLHNTDSEKIKNLISDQ